jgi:hypothetical protein
LLAFSWLEKDLQFPTPFEDTGSMRFTSADEVSTVESFGVRALQRSVESHQSIAEQVSIYDYQGPGDFILVLTTDSPDDQLVLASTKPLTTLEETVQAVQKRIDSSTQDSLNYGDSLHIPVIGFDLTHSYEELNGRDVLNRPHEGLYVGETIQGIRFSLDRHGAILGSYSVIPYDNGERHYAFYQPFLLYMREKSAGSPYFVFWAGTSEFLKSRK